MTPQPGAAEHRILLRAPTAKDGAMAETVLRRAGLDAHSFLALETLVQEMAHGAGAIVLAEESLADPAAAALTRALAEQPPWSDLPVLVLARQGADSHAIGQAMDIQANVTVIERPVRMASFVSSVRSARCARACASTTCAPCCRACARPTSARPSSWPHWRMSCAIRWHRC